MNIKYDFSQLEITKWQPTIIDNRPISIDQILAERLAASQDAPETPTERKRREKEAYPPARPQFTECHRRMAVMSTFRGIFIGG